jgi:hypothetical protein
MGPLDYWNAADTPGRTGMTQMKHVLGHLAFPDELRRWPLCKVHGESASRDRPTKLVDDGWPHGATGDVRSRYDGNVLEADLRGRDGHPAVTEVGVIECLEDSTRETRHLPRKFRCRFGPASPTCRMT